MHRSCNADVVEVLACVIDGGLAPLNAPFGIVVEIETKVPLSLSRWNLKYIVDFMGTPKDIDLLTTDAAAIETPGRHKFELQVPSIDFGATAKYDLNNAGMIIATLTDESAYNNNNNNSNNNNNTNDNNSTDYNGRCMDVSQTADGCDVRAVATADVVMGNDVNTAPLPLVTLNMLSLVTVKDGAFTRRVFSPL
eukprot:Opistho-2@72051